MPNIVQNVSLNTFHSIPPKFCICYIIWNSTHIVKIFSLYNNIPICNRDNVVVEHSSIYIFSLSHLFTSEIVDSYHKNLLVKEDLNCYIKALLTETNKDRYGVIYYYSIGYCDIKTCKTILIMYLIRNAYLGLSQIIPT